MRKLNTRWLGKLPYSEAYDLQLGLHKSVSNNLDNDDYLLLLEHDNVITSGRTSKEGNLLVSIDDLEEILQMINNKVIRIHYNKNYIDRDQNKNFYSFNNWNNLNSLKIF